MSKKLSKRERDRLNTSKFNTPEAKEKKKALLEKKRQEQEMKKKRQKEVDKALAKLGFFDEDIPAITCNECGGPAPRETFELLPTEDMPGVDLALFGICSDCNAPTLAATGTDENAVLRVMALFQKEMGGDLGFDSFKAG